MVPIPLSHTSVMPAYWHADNPAEFDLETGDGAEYGLEKPDECCLAFRRNVAMLELMAVHGSVVRWWYMLYGLAAPVYGHGGAPADGVAANEVPMPEANMPVEFIFTVTDDVDVLKQLTVFWWWFGATTDPNGFTGHGNVFAPSGDGTFVAQLLYGEYDEYRASVSANGCMNWVPKPFLKSAAATAAAFIALRSRLRHFARRFLNQTCSPMEENREKERNNGKIPKLIHNFQFETIDSLKPNHWLNGMDGWMVGRHAARQKNNKRKCEIWQMWAIHIPRRSCVCLWCANKNVKISLLFIHSSVRVCVRVSRALTSIL